MAGSKRAAVGSGVGGSKRLRKDQLADDDDDYQDGDDYEDDDRGDSEENDSSFESDIGHGGNDMPRSKFKKGYTERLSNRDDGDSQDGDHYEPDFENLHGKGLYYFQVNDAMKEAEKNGII